MSTDYGADVSAFPDLDPAFAPLTGRQVVSQAVVRRLSTPRGALPFYTDYGLDLRGWLNETMTRKKLAQLRRDVEAECLKDERIFAADASLAFNVQTSELVVTLAVTTATGPFTLVLGVTAVTISLLSTATG